jgi:hypothetical protein
VFDTVRCEDAWRQERQRLRDRVESWCAHDRSLGEVLAGAAQVISDLVAAAASGGEDEDPKEEPMQGNQPRDDIRHPESPAHEQPGRPS